MIQPEILLPKLTKSILRLRKTTSFLGENDFDDKLNIVLRKSRIAETMSGKYIIAIAGSQGAGKTTFIKNLYELDDTWLEGNQGRGEKTPLFIVEKNDIDTPEGWVEERGDSGEINMRKIIEPDEFKKALKGLTPNQLQLKLYVPERFFGGLENGIEMGFVLLPGYEIDNSEEFQELMRYTLVAASASIIVTDKTLLANSSQKKIMTDLKEHFLNGSKPLVVVSKTENMPQEHIDELRNSASEVFDIDSAKEERIMFAGSGDGEYRNSWRKKVEESMHRFGCIAKATRERQLEYLETLLKDDVACVLYEIEEAKKEHEILDNKNSTKDVLIGIFDKNAEKFRRLYHKEINKLLGELAQRTREIAKESYDSEESGLVQKVENFVNKSEWKREKARIERVKESWEKAATKECGSLRDILPKTLETLVKDNLAISNKHTDNDASHPAKIEQNITCIETLNDGVIWQIKSLFSPNEKEQDKYDNSKKELENAVKILPTLALEYARINSVFLNKNEIQVSAKDFERPKELGEKYKNKGGGFAEMLKTHNDVIKGIAAMLALDVAVDGKIDSIPMLFEAIGTILTGGNGMSKVGIAVSGIAVTGFIIYDIIGRVQKYNQEQRFFIDVATDSLKDSYSSYYMEFFDNLMERIKEALENRLNERYGLVGAICSIDALEKALADAKKVKIEILEAIRS